MPRYLAVFLALLIFTAPSYSKVKRRSSHRVTHRRASAARSRRETKARMPAARSAKAAVRPAPERYKEIQQALAAKGYYQGEIDGNWTPQSVEALKRFQADQNLTADGNLNSLSLIALDLGPKRALSAQVAPAQPGAQR